MVGITDHELELIVIEIFLRHYISSHSPFNSLQRLIEDLSPESTNQVLPSTRDSGCKVPVHFTLHNRRHNSELGTNSILNLFLYLCQKFQITYFASLINIAS